MSGGSERVPRLAATGPEPGQGRGPRFGRGPGRGGFHGPPGMMPAERARDFKGSLRRLLRLLAPYRLATLMVVALALGSVVFSIVGPRILGNATNLLFEGIIGKQFPAGLSVEQVDRMLRAAGRQELADMLGRMNVVPGRGVDFAAIRSVLLAAAMLYVLSAAFSWAQHYIMAGVSQRLVYRLRRDVDAKLARVPLKYYDSNTRGEILRRVTNDIDNIASTLQQITTQLITAAVTVVGVLYMMLSISPLLTLMALATLPLSLIVTLGIAGRSRGSSPRSGRARQAQRSHRGYTGHTWCRRSTARRRLCVPSTTNAAYAAASRAHFISGIIMPAALHQQPELRGSVRHRWDQGCRGLITLGDVQAFIQYARQFQPAHLSDGVHHERATEHRGLRRTGVRGADEAEETPDPAPARAPAASRRVEFRNVSFSTAGRAAD